MMEKLDGGRLEAITTTMTSMLLKVPHTQIQEVLAQSLTELFKKATLAAKERLTESN